MIKNLQFCEVNIQKIKIFIKDREIIWADLKFKKRKLANKLINKIRLVRSPLFYMIKIDCKKF